MTTRSIRGLSWLAIAVAGCLEPTPEDRMRDALPDDHDGDEFHRPGQPCRLCHDEFVVAGTVSLRADDPVGLEGVEVAITDAADRELVARSNRAGNFFVVVSDDTDTEHLRAGMTRVRWRPRFPLAIELRYAGDVIPMETLAWREGSCAGCHGPEVGADSVGPVYVLAADEVL